MFNNNLKNLRKQKGMSQDALAAELNVVRQTVSKWEKGLSVPDVETLHKIAEVLEVPISTLLGEDIKEQNANTSEAEQLAAIAEQLRIKNRRAKKIWKIFLILTVILIVVPIIIIVFGLVPFVAFVRNSSQGAEEVTAALISYVFYIL